MSRIALASAAARAYARLAGDYPGSIELLDAEEPEVIDCAVRVSSAERQAEDGGYALARQASAWVRKCDLPQVPALMDRARVKVRRPGCDDETFWLVESHDQSPDHWLLRMIAS